MKDPLIWSKFVSEFPKIITNIGSYSKLSRYISTNLSEAPNILLYSAPGFPVNLLWNHVATLKWGSFTKKECTYLKAAVYLETPFFFEIDFRHPLNSKSMDDINDLLKTIITASCIHTDRHIIVCHNIDVLTSDVFSFRVLLERYSKNAMFICTTHAISNIERPLRSRFFEIRVPLFTHHEIVNIIATLNYEVPDNLQTRNIFKALFLTEVKNKDSNVATFNYPDIAKLPNNPTILQLREISNKVCNSNVPFSMVVTDLLQTITTQSKKHAFVEKAANLEHKLALTNQGRKPLYYELLFNLAFYGHF